MCGGAGRFAVQGPLLGRGDSSGQAWPLEHRLDVSRLNQGEFRLPSPRRDLSAVDYDYDYDYDYEIRQMMTFGLLRLWIDVQAMVDIETSSCAPF